MWFVQGSSNGAPSKHHISTRGGSSFYEATARIRKRRKAAGEIHLEKAGSVQNQAGDLEAKRKEKSRKL
jgi:hypothetical protein